jgi:hypothetical protein
MWQRQLSCEPRWSTRLGHRSSRVAAKEPEGVGDRFWLDRHGVDHGCTSDNSAFAQSCSTQDRPSEHRKDDRSEGEFGAEKIRRPEGVRKALVAARNPGKRRARSEAGRLHAAGSKANCSIAQALRGTKFAAQDRRLPLGAFHVDVLYQPRRQDVAEDATRPAAARQDRVEASVWKRLAVIPGRE